MNNRKRYGMLVDQSLIEANDLGLINGHITLNGWKHDVAEIRGLYVPPFFSKLFCFLKYIVKLLGKSHGNVVPVCHYNMVEEIYRNCVESPFKLTGKLHVLP